MFYVFSLIGTLYTEYTFKYDFKLSTNSTKSFDWSNK